MNSKLINIICIICFEMFSSILAADNFFPICAWMGHNVCMEPENLEYEKILATIDSAEACGFNMVYIGNMPGNWSANGGNWNTAPLERISQKGMKCLLGTANIVDTPPNTFHNVEWFSSAVYRKYEAESDTFFQSEDNVYLEEGCRVLDAGFSGYLIRNYQEPPNPYFDNVTDCRMAMGGGWYDMPVSNYRLTYRIKYVGKDDGSNVCKLVCRKITDANNIETIEIDLNTHDFIASNSFSEASLQFAREVGETRHMDYQLYSYGNKKIYIDYVELHNACFDSLSTGYYDSEIQDIFNTYSYPGSPVFRYFFFDEAVQSQLDAQRIVNEKIDRLGSCVIGPNVINNYTPLSWQYALAETTYFDKYVSIVSPRQIITNMVILSGEQGGLMGYPYTGSGNSGFRTPCAGKGLQDQYDILCNLSRIANRVGKQNNIPWFIEVNIFGDSLYEQDSVPKEGIWRKATPQEARCMVNLSLCHGAKGIYYYQFVEGAINYKPYWGTDKIYKQISIVDTFGIPVDTPLYEAVKETNIRIQKLAPVLLNIDCDYSFRKQNGLLADTQVIRDISDTLVQMGTFHSKGSSGWDDIYFMVVNRNCLPVDTIHDLALKVWYPYPFKIKDVLKAREYSPDSLSPEIASRASDFNYHVTLAPGEGRLYQIIPDDIYQDITINNYNWVYGLFDEWYSVGNIYADNDNVEDNAYIRFTSEDGHITLGYNFNVSLGAQFEANVVDHPIIYSYPAMSLKYSGQKGIKNVYPNNGEKRGEYTNNVPKEFALQQTFPNPSIGVTVIRYQIPKTCPVGLSIYNIGGQLVKQYKLSMQGPGYYTLKWDAKAHANGVYIYKLTAGDFHSVKRMMLLK